MTTTTEPISVKLPFIEALTDATRAELAPLRLHPNDYIEIWIEQSQSGELYFGASAVCARRLSDLEAANFHPSLVRRDHEGNAVSTSARSASIFARGCFKSVPESKPLWAKDASREGEWRLAQTDTTALMLHHWWPNDRFIFRSEEARIAYTFLIRRFYAQNARATMQAEFKINRVQPKNPVGYADSALPLSDYQRAAVAFSVGQEATGLFMEQGTGKTAVTISRVCCEARQTRSGRFGEPRMMRVLIVTPNQVRLNWEKEFHRFASAPGKVTIIRGGAIKRVKTLIQAIRSEDDCAFSAVIVGIDTATIDYATLAKVQWDLCIIDESHYIKSDSTKRWKAMRVLRESCHRRQVLTGSPIANTIFDIWTQLEFIGEGLSGFTSKKEFRGFFGKYKVGPRDAAGNSVTKLIGFKNLPLFQERLARLSFSITQKEAGLELPEMVMDWREVTMTSKQTDIYRQMASQLAVEIEQILSNSTVNQQMTAEHILTRLLRLAQITSGHVKWDPQYDDEGNAIDGTGRVEQINPGSNPKVIEVLRMIEEDAETQPDSKMVIWATFVPDIQVLSDALTKAGIKHGTYYGGTSQADRERFYHDYNHDPEMKVLIANPATAAEGLNLVGYDWDGDGSLPTYTGHVIYFSRNWSYIHRVQSLMRTTRRGTKMPVRVTDLVVPGTIDEEMCNRVETKGQVATSLQDIKDILESILDFDGDDE